MENNQTSSSSSSSNGKSFTEQIKDQAKKGFTTGVGIAAFAAPILVVVSLVGWISKKN